MIYPRSHDQVGTELEGTQYLIFQLGFFFFTHTRAWAQTQKLRHKSALPSLSTANETFVGYRVLS